MEIKKEKEVWRKWEEKKYKENDQKVRKDEGNTGKEENSRDIHT